MKLKIAVLDKITLGNDLDYSGLYEFGDVIINSVCTDADMERLTADADITISNKVRYNADTLKKAKNLKLICLTATGYDNCDISYLKERGIALCNVPSYSTDSVAQHVFALLFQYMEKINRFEALVHTRAYVDQDLYGMVPTRFFELRGKTWGIIGLGKIGKRVAKIASVFGCNVIYYSTSGKNDDKEYKRVGLDTLLAMSDVISIHAPLNKETTDLITKKELQKMKPSACLINVGRGGIVNETDLVEALKNKEIGGACIDVFEKEPIRPESPYLTLHDYTNLILTPHIAWSAVESRQRAIDECTENIRAFLYGEKRNRVI